MSNSLRKQIRNNFDLKETEELVEIWQKHDRGAWSADTFSVIQEILQERLGELPPQDDPIWESIDDDEDEDLPVFYNPHEVLRLEKWLGQAAIAAIIAIAASNLLGLQQMQRMVLGGFFMNNTQMNLVAWLIAIVSLVFAAGLQGILVYFPLKALGSILGILMEMEFNSRGAAKGENV